MPNIDSRLEIKAKYQGSLTNYEFLYGVIKLFLSEHGYITLCGSNTEVNAEAYLRIIKKIRKHPLLWKLFFLIA